MGHADMEFAHSIEDVTSTYKYYLLCSMLRGTTVTVLQSAARYLASITFHRKSVCFNPLIKKDISIYKKYVFLARK